MHTSRLFVARVRTQAGLLTGIFAALAITVVMLIGGTGWLAAETHAALRALVTGDDTGTDPAANADLAAAADADPTKKVVQTRLPEGTTAQAAQATAAEALFAERFGDSARIERTQTPQPEERVRWTITAVSEGIDAERVHQLHRGFIGFASALTDAGITPRGALFTGALDETVATAARELDALAALTPLPVLLAAGIGWIALWQLARLLAAVRRDENELLRGRGLARGQHIALALWEAIVLSIGAGAAGWLVAGAALLLLAGTDTIATTARAWPIVLVALALSVLTLVGSEALAAPKLIARAERQGRPAQIATLSTVALFVFLAALLVWQLRLHGAAVASASGWELAVTALAPAAVIAAGVVISFAVLVPIATVVAGALARGSQLTPVFVARQVSRRPGTFAVLFVLVSAGVAIAVLAAATTGTLGVMGASPIVSNLAPLWWMSVAGGLLLALAALVAVTAAQLRSRRPDVGLLRALGLGVRAQARLRTAELLSIAAVGVVFGGVIGAVTAVLLVPDLLRGAVSEAASEAWAAPEGIAVTFDVLPLVLALLAFFVGLAALAAVQSRAVRAQSRDALPAGGAA